MISWNHISLSHPNWAKIVRTNNQVFSCYFLSYCVSLLFLISSCNKNLTLYFSILEGNIYELCHLKSAFLKYYNLKFEEPVCIYQYLLSLKVCECLSKLAFCLLLRRVKPIGYNSYEFFVTYWEVWRGTI